MAHDIFPFVNVFVVTNILTRNYHEFLHFLILSQYIIQSMISKKKLIAFNGEVKMTATIHFIEDLYAYSIPKIISIFFLFGLYAKYRFDIAKFLKKRKKSKFSKK